MEEPNQTALTEVRFVEPSAPPFGGVVSFPAAGSADGELPEPERSALQTKPPSQVHTLRLGSLCNVCCTEEPNQTSILSGQTEVRFVLQCRTQDAGRSASPPLSLNGHLGSPAKVAKCSCLVAT